MGQSSYIFLSVLLTVQWLVCWRLALRLLPPIARGTEPLVSVDKISIVIPARNEESNLPVLLESLASQRIQPFEIIVVDDDSEDATASIAREYGVRIVRPGAPPSGWRGKTWACQSGANQAQGELLLFLDADTWLAPEHGLSRVVEKYPGGAYSLVPWHHTESGAEAFSAFFNLLMALGTIPSGLAGPCLMISKTDYKACGGHESVKDRILENVSLGGVLKKCGVPTRSGTGRGIVSFRMYPGGFSELIPGWTKGFAAGAASTPPRALALIIIWMSSLWIAAVSLAFSPAFIFVYTLFAIQLGWMLRQVGKFPVWTALFYPVPLAFHLVVFLRSLGKAGKQTTWKGRRVASDVD